MPRRKTKPSACAMKRSLKQVGIDFDDDFFTLSATKKAKLVRAAKEAGYRKRRDAPGSTARMYFQYLARKNCP